MVKVKFTENTIEITGVDKETLKRLKKLFPVKKKHYIYDMKVGFIVTNEQGELSYEEDIADPNKNKDLYR